MIFFGERKIRHVIGEYMEHYNQERPHKGIEYRRPIGPPESPTLDGKVACRERLGGLLKSYYRQAA
jgi:putative transposase